MHSNCFTMDHVRVMKAPVPKREKGRQRVSVHPEQSEGVCTSRTEAAAQRGAHCLGTMQFETVAVWVQGLRWQLRLCIARMPPINRSTAKRRSLRCRMRKIPQNAS